MRGKGPSPLRVQVSRVCINRWNCLPNAVRERDSLMRTVEREGRSKVFLSLSQMSAALLCTRLVVDWLWLSSIRDGVAGGHDLLSTLNLRIDNYTILLHRQNTIQQTDRHSTIYWIIISFTVGVFCCCYFPTTSSSSDCASSQNFCNPFLFFCKHWQLLLLLVFLLFVAWCHPISIDSRHCGNRVCS